MIQRGSADLSFRVFSFLSAIHIPHPAGGCLTPEHVPASLGGLGVSVVNQRRWVEPTLPLSPISVLPSFPYVLASLRALLGFPSRSSCPSW